MQAYSDPSLRDYYARDQGELPPLFRVLFAAPAAEILQPKNAAEAQQAVARSKADGAAIVPRGAGSTAFGQVVPMRGGRVVDVCFMKGIVGLDAERNEVT